MSKALFLTIFFWIQWMSSQLVDICFNICFFSVKLIVYFLIGQLLLPEIVSALSFVSVRVSIHLFRADIMFSAY